MEFKKQFNFETRKNEAQRILKKYPDRIPIIVQKIKNSNLPELDKQKYLVPNNLTIGQFLYVIRQKLPLQSTQALFIFINGTLPSVSSIISQIYKEHKSECGFLFCFISGENAFGREIIL